MINLLVQLIFEERNFPSFKILRFLHSASYSSSSRDSLEMRSAYEKEVLFLSIIIYYFYLLLIIL